MDSYPKDLLVGVFPLVFAVNAILSEQDSPQAEGPSSPSRRSLFDHFLNAVAASLVEEGEPDQGSSPSGDKKRNVSLFRPDEDDESSDDDDLEEIGQRRPGTFSPGLYAGFGRKNLPRNTPSASGAEGKASYAKALTLGQGFFQRARIESVSPRHGFPPSKDPDGAKNLAHAFPRALKANSHDDLASIFRDHPLDGILPAGWLEKHVAALPSVILVVCTVCSSQKEQDEQDAHLFETIEHLQESLVPKRLCKIYVVGLMKEGVTMIQSDEWSRAMSNNANFDESSPPPKEPPFLVTLLRAGSDLQCSETGMPASHALKQLHRSVRDASFSYYLGQARRTKQKLALLTEDKRRRGQETPPMPLMPLVIRYCFKIAMFYEFQWKHEKSLKFMGEAYRHILRYYQYLIFRQGRADGKEDNAPSKTPAHRSHAVAESEDSVEVALNGMNSNDDDDMWSSVVPPPPDDMIQQCRAIAEWLNLKLLLAGFGSHTEGGVLAAADQWRQHSRVFCSRSCSTALTGEHWYEWAYIARQRVVMSQLVERHPPKALGDFGNEYDEILLRCSPWRTCEAAAEAMLRLAREVDKAKASGPKSNSLGSSPMRERYVGSLDSEELAQRLQEESRVGHREKALELVLKAISILEHELEKEKRGFYAEDHFRERSSSRTGARLYYLAGGILLGMNRHEEAAAQLAKATKHAKGWRELELAIRRMLIECYGKHIPSPSDASESSQTLASMILDSYFNAEMSSRDLRRALGHFASLSGGESLKWYHASVNEEDPSVPFSFAVTFPGTTHATAGEPVKASILIKSNLDYAVHVNSVVVLSLAGELPIPTNDLLSAQNASEGGEGSIIIQAKTEIVLSTKVNLPRDLSIIAANESGNGGEIQGIAGKGSFATRARPRCAGITSAGGARLVSEEALSKGNNVSQGWSLRFLGGKSLRCDGLKVVFYPVQAERATGSLEKVTLIELTIEMKKAKTAADIKRTPYEEDNYVASAWSRPEHVPFSRGPRCLRVLGPQPELVISNLSDPVTDGKALEGTVNRILLKLQAGQNERCTDVKFSVSCFSILMTPNGSTKRLVSQEELTAALSDCSVNMKDPIFRTPSIVMSTQESSSQTSTDYGYDLPPGWDLAEAGQGYTGTIASSMKGGESVFLPLHFFRPATLLLDDRNMCKTDFYVTVTYKQERSAAQKQKVNRRTSRQRPVMSGSIKVSGANGNPPEQNENSHEDAPVARPVESSDEVSLEYSGSIVWAHPLCATFSQGVRRNHPSGSRHPSNAVNNGVDAGLDDEFALIDGETVTLKCSLQAGTAVEGLNTEIVSVRFLNDPDPESPLDLSLTSGDSDSDVLYKAGPSELSRVLSPSSKLSLAYTVQGYLKDDYKKGGVTSSLGAILVDWLPSTIHLPDEVQKDSTGLDGIKAHGPLALETPSTMSFAGPLCYIESTPFEAKLQSVPSAPKVAVPFEVNYQIKNKTKVHQTLSVSMNESSAGAAVQSDGLLISGMINGELYLAPDEEQCLSYTVLALRAGKAALPSLRVSSARYKSWVINDDRGCNRPLYIFP